MVDFPTLMFWIIAICPGGGGVVRRDASQHRTQCIVSGGGVRGDFWYLSLAQRRIHCDRADPHLCGRSDHSYSVCSDANTY